MWGSEGGPVGLLCSPNAHENVIESFHCGRCSLDARGGRPTGPPSEEKVSASFVGALEIMRRLDRTCLPGHSPCGGGQGKWNGRFFHEITNA